MSNLRPLKITLAPKEALRRAMQVPAPASTGAKAAKKKSANGAGKKPTKKK